MKFKNSFILLILFCLPLFAQNSPQKEKDNIADKPLFRDPIYDEAADPTIIWNKKQKNEIAINNKFALAIE